MFSERVIYTGLSVVYNMHLTVFLFSSRKISPDKEERRRLVLVPFGPLKAGKTAREKSSG